MVVLQAEGISKLETVLETLVTQGAHLGITVVKAVLIFVIGRFVINLLNKLVRKMMDKRDVDPSVRSFVASLVNITLTILLIIAVIGALGVQTTSFAALLASVGVAVGMALSGNLSNFAGGLIILLFKPYRVGDYIEALGTGGTVKEIQIFHTILTTSDGKTVYVPNGSMSSGQVTNFNVEYRRIEWIVGIEYGTDVNKVKAVVDGILASDGRILPEPAPFFELHALADSSVKVVIRVWVKTADYWDTYFQINKAIYESFNEAGIGFPFPQLTIHRQA